MSKFLKIAAVVVFSSVFSTAVFAEDAASTGMTDQQTTVETSTTSTTDTATPAKPSVKKHHHKKKHVKKSKNTSTTDTATGKIQGSSEATPATPDQTTSPAQ